MVHGHGCCRENGLGRCEHGRFSLGAEIPRVQGGDLLILGFLADKALPFEEALHTPKDIPCNFHEVSLGWREALVKLRLGLVIGSNEDTVDDDQLQVRVHGQCLRESLDERDLTARDIFEPLRLQGVVRVVCKCVESLRGLGVLSSAITNCKESLWSGIASLFFFEDDVASHIVVEWHFYFAVVVSVGTIEFPCYFCEVGQVVVLVSGRWRCFKCDEALFGCKGNTAVGSLASRAVNPFGLACDDALALDRDLHYAGRVFCWRNSDTEAPSTNELCAFFYGARGYIVIVESVHGERRVNGRE